MTLTRVGSSADGMNGHLSGTEPLMRRVVRQWITVTDGEDVPISPTQTTFDHVSTHTDLVAWSRRYARQVVDRDDVAVDLSLVDWEVSTRAKRRAAAVKRPRIPEAAVGTPLSWSDLDATRGASVRRCTVSLTWAAAEAFDVDEWRATLRHELIHVEQFQRFGTTNHGPEFERRADALDTPVRCRRFATPKFVLSCTACEATVARRYRECSLVREYEDYQSSCCEAALRCRRLKNQ
ncbi:SprT-like domain-containing protein [Halogranum rubrum]|nr:SprT-like domain-containing protein [Halogranum rubrum]